MRASHAIDPGWNLPQASFFLFNFFLCFAFWFSLFFCLTLPYTPVLFFSLSLWIKPILNTIFFNKNHVIFLNSILPYPNRKQKIKPCLFFFFYLLLEGTTYPPQDFLKFSSVLLELRGTGQRFFWFTILEA